MTSPSKCVDSPSKSTTRRRTRRRGPTQTKRLFLEELESRCMLSVGALWAEQAAGQSISALGQDLYSLLQGQSGGGGNLIMSPASVATALAMTDAGAGGETASQISSVLHAANVDPNTLAQEFGSLLTDLNSAGAGQYALSVADALWGQQGFPFNQAFLNLVQADYGGGFNQVDFARNPDGAAQTINDWVAQQTDDRIQELFPPGSLSASVRLVLTNAIYFNGDWATPFNTSGTFNSNFTLFSGDQVQTATMHNTSEFGYMDSDGYQVLEMPYVGGRLAMDVILPSAASGLQGLDASQLPANLSAWLGGLSEQQVEVSLPKFDMTSQFDLSAPLQTLGMTDAFSNQANFSGISSMPLQIFDVVQKAYISVTETGTEAAAATSIGVTTTVAFPFLPPPPVVFNADHPFLFVIRDTQSGSVLFEGQVADPTSLAADPTAPPAPPSAPSHVMAPTAPAPPSAPSNVVAATGGPNTLAVSWTPGSAGSAGPTTSYVVQMSGPGFGNYFVTVATVDGGTSSATISSLLPNTSYRFQVLALNAAGASAPSSAASGTTANSNDGAASIPAGVSPAAAQLIIADYQQFLARTPAAGEVYFWARAIDDGALTPRAAALEIENSLEGDTDQVTQVFDRYLHRAPDAQGLQYFVSYMQSGASINVVTVQILGSDEYYALVGGSDLAFVNSLYQNVLDRNPAPGEATAWPNALAQGQSRAQIAAGFLSSAEHVQDEIVQLYGQLLDRPPDPSGAAAWELMFANGLAFEQAAAGIAASAEFLGVQ